MIISNELHGWEYTICDGCLDMIEPGTGTLVMVSTGLLAGIWSQLEKIEDSGSVLDIIAAFQRLSQDTPGAYLDFCPWCVVDPDRPIPYRLTGKGDEIEDDGAV